MQPNLEELLDYTKYDLMVHKNTAFISSVVYHLKFEWDSTIPTAQTNGLSLKFNPEFFKVLHPKQRIFVLAHEGWHVALKHLTRFTDICKTKEDFNLLNMAGDYVINLMCHEAGMDTIQSPVYLDGKIIFNKSLLDHRFDGMSTDEVFMFLKKVEEHNKNKPNQPLPDKINGTSTNGFSIPSSPDMDDLDYISTTASIKEVKELEEAIDEIIVNAATVAHAKGEFGTLPSHLQAEIKNIISPPLPWYTLFMRFMNSFTKNDYSYSRPNRRYLPDIVIPSLHSITVERVVFACDISASVSDEEFSLYLAKIKEARNLLRPQITHIITFDTKVQGHFELGPMDSIDNIDFHGRGGTNPNSVFEYFEDNPRKKPSFIVFFSDMDFGKINYSPNYPVLWIGVSVYGKVKKPSIGQYIEYSRYK